MHEEKGIQAAMAELYDHYFSVRDYSQRYPRPNQSTLSFMLNNGVNDAENVLDFGCGNGRYALSVLQQTAAHVTGYDISAAALEEFREHLSNASLIDRTTLIHGDLSALRTNKKFDVALMLFGVLSHIGDKPRRIEALRHVHTLMKPAGRLILSVPCKWRRRPREAMLAAWNRTTGRASGIHKEAGNIQFSRTLGGKKFEFFYHLYSVSQLNNELAQAGFRADAIEAESVLPEWLVTKNRLLGAWDSRVAKALPASLGYGLRVSAVAL